MPALACARAETFRHAGAPTTFAAMTATRRRGGRGAAPRGRRRQARVRAAHLLARSRRATTSSITCCSFNIDRRWRAQRAARARLGARARRDATSTSAPARSTSAAQLVAAAGLRAASWSAPTSRSRCCAPGSGKAPRDACCRRWSPTRSTLPLADDARRRRDRRVRHPQRRRSRRRTARGAPRARAGRAVRDPRVLDAARRRSCAPATTLYFHHMLPLHRRRSSAAIATAYTYLPRVGRELSRAQDDAGGARCGGAGFRDVQWRDADVRRSRPSTWAPKSAAARRRRID